MTADIEAGRIKPGERIPSESELCERHGVARETVRRAVRVLRERGVVETEWGKGTFVRDRSEPRRRDRYLGSISVQSRHPALQRLDSRR
ncbi:GntR family transcriptional regulator [Streptomyces scopuliridis]|uniref:GntR family transcriptional regulator n=1 Tax=Streptomyces scopuliridis TaxID=452529 RepID=UPI00367654F8